MMRHFVKAAGVCLLLAHSSAEALSVGNIRVKSALNQRFNADIVLSLNAGDNPNDIHVQLAPYDKFSGHGVPWDRELLKLRFEPVQSNGRSVVIRVRSNGVISEPVLVFLLQVSSPKGTIYRQFTVLLEPPANYEPVRVRKYTEPEIAVARHHYTPRNNGFYVSAHEKKLPVPVRAKPSSPAPEIRKKTDWVHVRNNDSVSKIAKRLYAGDSYEQMAIALYMANPKAFFSPNINALKAGQVLRVPERKAVQKLSAFEARAEFYRQNRAWKDRLVTPLEPQVLPPTEADAPVPVQKKLTLSAPETPMDLNALLLSDKVNTAIKPVDSVDALSEKVQGLQERLNKMEQQMAGMQKLLLVKDEQLALLQSQATGDPKSPKHQSRLDRFLNALGQFFTAGSKSSLYIVIGFLELVGLGLIGYYTTKKTQAKKVKLDRY